MLQILPIQIYYTQQWAVFHFPSQLCNRGFWWRMYVVGRKVTLFYSKSCVTWHLLLCIAFVSGDWCSDIKKEHVKNDTQTAAVTNEEAWNDLQENVRKYSVRKARSFNLKIPTNPNPTLGTKHQQVWIHRSAVFKKRTTDQILFPLEQHEVTSAWLQLCSEEWLL